MLVSLVVAVDNHLAIGNKGDLLWRLPKDMARFKEITKGHHVLMGRKTYLSIPPKFRPLPNRTNLVASRKEGMYEEGVIAVKSIEEGISYAKEKGEKELMIIGGGEIYNHTLHLADKIYLTKVQHSFEADTYFPFIDPILWQITTEEEIKKDEKNAYDMHFQILERRSGK